MGGRCRTGPHPGSRRSSRQYRLRSIETLGAGRPATETPLPRCVAENRLPSHECQGTQEFVISPDERRIAALFRPCDAAVAGVFRTRVWARRSIRKGRFPLVNVDCHGHEAAGATSVCPAWAQYGHDTATNETGTVSYRSAAVTTDQTAPSTGAAGTVRPTRGRRFRSGSTRQKRPNADDDARRDDRAKPYRYAETTLSDAFDAERGRPVAPVAGGTRAAREAPAPRS